MLIFLLIWTMLISLLILLLLSNALISRRDKSILFSRVVILSLISTSYLALNNLFILPLEKGIGIYGGLFNVTTFTQTFNIFIFIITAVILIFISNAFIRKNYHCDYLLLKARVIVSPKGPIIFSNIVIIIFKLIGFDFSLFLEDWSSLVIFNIHYTRPVGPHEPDSVQKNITILNTMLSDLNAQGRKLTNLMDHRATQLAAYHQNQLSAQEISVSRRWLALNKDHIYLKYENVNFINENRRQFLNTLHSYENDSYNMLNHSLRASPILTRARAILSNPNA